MIQESKSEIPNVKRTSERVTTGKNIEVRKILKSLIRKKGSIARMDIKKINKLVSAIDNGIISKGKGNFCAIFELFKIERDDSRVEFAKKFHANNPESTKSEKSFISTFIIFEKINPSMSESITGLSIVHTYPRIAFLYRVLILSLVKVTRVFLNL